MKSLQAPEQIASPTVGNAKHRLASLSSLIGLSAGALGWSSLASANDEGRDLQTLILPDTYSALDDGTVILQLETGEQLTLTADQYVILDGGLLLVVDELAQNSVAELPVLGSLRTQLFTEVQPVRSPDGTIVEATNQQPLWSGEGPAPRLFEEIDIQRFEIAQDQQGEDENDEGLFLGGAGGALVGIGITTLGIMNTGGADDDGDESTDGGGSDGGDDGGSGENVANRAPSFTSTAPTTVDEGTSASFYTLMATDPDAGDTITYSITGGDDASKFELDGSNGLRFKASAVPDYLMPGSNDGDNDYHVEITASDGNGGTDVQQVTVSVLCVAPLHPGNSFWVRLDGVAEADQSGYSVSSAGDVDGDGKDDILIGAYNADPGGDAGAGETYLVFGEALDGDGTDDITLTSGGVDLGNLGTHGFRFDGIDSSDKSGWSVSSAGDVDGDGKDDILIGAYSADPGGDANAGETYLVFGKALDGVGGDDIPLTSGGVDLGNLGTHGFRFDGIDAGDFAGYSVSSAGDVDGDGKDDILIGAYRAFQGGVGSVGETYLVFGKALDGVGGDDIPLTSGGVDLGNLGTHGFRFDGIDYADYSGQSVSSAGDVDGDGKDDILISANSGDGEGNNSVGSGETYLVFGKSLDGVGGDDIPLTSGGVDLGDLGTHGVTVYGRDEGDRSGVSVSSAGDIDGDGKDDILIGAHFADRVDGTIMTSGETYLVFGSHLATNPETMDLADLSGGKGVVMINIGHVDYGSRNISSAGDVDGDGIPDILISADNHTDPDGDKRGEAYLVFGSHLATKPETVDLDDLSGGKGVRLDGIDHADDMSWGLSSAGDIDGDCRDDILIGARFADPGGNAGSGETYLISGYTLDLAADGIGVATPGVIDLAADLGLG